MPSAVSEDELPQVEAQVSALIDERHIDTTADFARVAEEIQGSLDAGSLSPDDPPFWRAVIAALRRRAISVC
jgi:hypothetical protein